MSSKYTALPLSQRRSASPPSKLSTYQTTLHYATDIEQDAPQMPNGRSRRAIPDQPSSLPAYDSDPRFKMETPSPITRAALLAFVCFLFWLAFNLRKGVWMATGMGMEKQDMEGVDSLSY